MEKVILNRKEARLIYSCKPMEVEHQHEKARKNYIAKLIRRKKLVELCLDDLSILSESMYRRYIK